MKIITVIAEQVSPEALSAAFPEDGVVSVTVTETQTFTRTAISVESYRGRKIARHTSAADRIEIVAEDTAVGRVAEGIAFARGAGLLGDARAWVSAEATDGFTGAPAAATTA